MASTPTITDVAARAGVSIKTVSRVVNREAGVRAATRERVEAVIREMKYRPHPAARGLAGRRSFTIALVYENPKEFGYLQRLFEGAFAACNSLGYSLVLCPCDPSGGHVEEDIRPFLSRTRVDGVMLTVPLCDDLAVLGLLEELELPCVRISAREAHPRWPDIGCSERQASRELVEHLHGLGHRRIGVILGHPDHGASARRLNGVRDGLSAHGLDLDPTLVAQGYFDFDSGKRAAARLLDLEDRPTAVVAGNDEMAAGVIHEAHERGLTVPGDLSVVGFDDSPTAAHLWPPLTTVAQPLQDLGSLATDLLLAQVGGAPPPPAAEELPCSLVVRRSTGPAPAI